MRSLKAQGIGIFFEEQNIDTLKNESELYLVIYAGFAQSESESISKHITWTYRKKFEEGKVSFQYKNFLGYRKGADSQPEIVPEEAAIVERIYEMFLAGQPVKMIVQTLQAEKIEIPGKNLSFSKNMIMNILRNEKYCGDCILHKGTVAMIQIATVLFNYAYLKVLDIKVKARLVGSSQNLPTSLFLYIGFPSNCRRQKK